MPPPARRMPLRQLLTYSEKSTRDLLEYLRSFLLPRVSEFRDLSRPVRRRSSYPSMLAVRNSLKKLRDASEEAFLQSQALAERLEEIREHALREQAARSGGRR